MDEIQLTPLARELGLRLVPAHVGVIMDGNGRWAQKRGMPRMMGHRAGVETLRDVIRFSSDVGIQVLSLYAFSTENWKRPADEVGGLMRLLVEFLYKEIDELDANGVRIRFMGDIDALPAPQHKAVEYGLEKTKDNTGLIVNIALNYGARAEIARAARELAAAAVRGELDAAAITEQSVTDALYTAGLPDVDLVIRTSGEMRLSNFMLYQCSYAEFYFPEVLWPDFSKEEYAKVLLQFQQRDRRYGGVK
ncbi:MAG: isoprenyl transferase [Eubacteriales bacterium]|nr:isoprenyl transferase [Eubacteriales bacterium]